MDIDPSLLGLNNYELKAYETLIVIGKCTATKVSKESGVPHGKIYPVLDSLMKKGLIDAIPKEPKEFIPNSPDLLKSLLQRKNKEIENVKDRIDKLKTLYKEDKEPDESKLIVRQGHKSFYKILEVLKTPEKYNYAIKWNSEYHNSWAKKHKDQLNKGIDVKVLARYDDETEKNIKKWLKVNKNIKKMENEGVAISIQDDEEVMITLPKMNSIILIKDEALAKVIRRLFLEAYKNSEDIK